MQELSHIPVQDIVIGLASATLLILALVYVARSQSGVPLALTGPEARAEKPELFKQVFSYDTGRGLSFLASLFLHILVIALVPWLQLWTLRIALPAFRSGELVLLEYRIPDVPLLAPDELITDEKKPAKKGGETPAGTPSFHSRQQPSKEELQAKAQSEPVSSSKPASPKKKREVFKQAFKVVLPEIAPIDPALKDVILQPGTAMEFPPEYAPQLPPILAWAPHPRELESALLVEPGHKEPKQAERWELPDAEPQLVPPSEPQVLSELQVAPSPVVIEKPVLPVLPGHGTPLRGVVPLREPVPQLPVLSEGDSATALIALNQEPNPLNPSFLLEIGLKLGRIGSGVKENSRDLKSTTDLSGAFEGVETGEDDPGGKQITSDPNQAIAFTDPSRVASGKVVSEGSEDSNDEAGHEAGSRSGDALVAAGSIRGRGSKPAGNLSDPERPLVPGARDDGATGSRAASGIGAEEGSATGSGDQRPLQPLPRKQYGIILVSNGQSALVEAAGVLRGSPIYTVHFDVPEAARKWVLQFCIPNSSSKRLEVSNGVIRIRPRKKVAPPYPQRKKPLRLNGSHVQSDRPSRVIVYATVDERGTLGNLRVVLGADPQTDNTILANLRSWEFLPAFRGEEPILVEALFGIPLP